MNKKLEHKSIRERDENKILHEGIVLLEKGNNCLKNKMKNEQPLQAWIQRLKEFSQTD